MYINYVKIFQNILFDSVFLNKCLACRHFSYFDFSILFAMDRDIRVRKVSRVRANTLHIDNEVAATRKAVDMDIRTKRFSRARTETIRIIDEVTETKEVDEMDRILISIGGYGRFQLIIQIIFAIACIPELYHILISYFILDVPDWSYVVDHDNSFYIAVEKSTNMSRCQMPRSKWNYTKEADYSVVTEFDINCGLEWLVELSSSIIYVGIGIGAILAGWAVDNFGRRAVLIPSFILMQLSSIVIIFSKDIYTFMVLRVLVGIFIPGVGFNMTTLISELVLPQHRVWAILGVLSMFPIGLALLSLLAYLVPAWKQLVLLSSIASSLVLIFFDFIPESIRWLHLHGRMDEVIATLKRIAIWNKVSSPDDLKLHSTSEIIQTSKPSDLFASRQLAKVTIILSSTWFVHNIIYYGIILAADDLTSDSIYLNFALTCLVELPANVMCAFVLSKCGRKKPMMTFAFLAGLSCIVISAIPVTSSWQFVRLILGVLGRFCAAVAYNGLFVWTAELYPTGVRGQGLGFVNFVSRCGGITMPWIAKRMRLIHPILPFAVMGGMPILNTAFLALLPETKDKLFQTTFEEKELSHINEAYQK